MIRDIGQRADHRYRYFAGGVHRAIRGHLTKTVPLKKRLPSQIPGCRMQADFSSPPIDRNVNRCLEKLLADTQAAMRFLHPDPDQLRPRTPKESDAPARCHQGESGSFSGDLGNQQLGPR